MVVMSLSGLISGGGGSGKSKNTTMENVKALSQQKLASSLYLTKIIKF